MQALDAVQLDLDSLAGDCTHINGALAGAKAASADMAADTEHVSRQLAASQLRSRLAEQFLQQYQLSPEEVAALQVLSSQPQPRVCSDPARLLRILKADIHWDICRDTDAGQGPLSKLDVTSPDNPCTGKSLSLAWSVSAIACAGGADRGAILPGSGAGVQHPCQLPVPAAHAAPARRPGAHGPHVLLPGDCLRAPLQVQQYR